MKTTNTNATNEFACIVFFILIATIASSKIATSSDLKSQNQSILLQATEIIYQKSTNVITAIGNVELSRGSRVILADEISFNKTTGVVVANNNVILLEENGDVVFANSVELADDFKHGFIKNIKVKMQDGSRLAANSAELFKGESKVMKQAVFSPCRPCENEPESALIWQIKADEIIHDEKNKDIDYQNATLEFFNIPVFFTPYFTHPDPTVKRRSGLLPPTLSYSESKGFIYGQPYFLTLGRSKDLELKPTIYTEEGFTLESHYRKAFSNGFINLETSLGILDNSVSSENSKKMSVEGSVSLKTSFSLNDTWRAQFDIEQTSDKSYTRRYLSEDTEMLTSRLLVEGFRARNYFSLEGYKFQGLRSFDTKGQQPKVLPTIFYNFVGEPDNIGGRPELETTFRSISRQFGNDSHIFSLSTGWKLPYYSTNGSLFEFNAVAQSDLFIADKDTQDTTLTNQNNNEFGARMFPQLGLKWVYPMFREAENTHQILEPIINVVIAPNIIETSIVPNEDSRGFEYDNTNIFEFNRYSGINRLTEGSRIDYGIKGSWFVDNLLNYDFFFGQSYHLWGKNTFDHGSGLEDDFSDFVGQAFFSPADWAKLAYRFRLDKNNFTPNRSELGFEIKNNSYNFSFDYVLLDEYISTEILENREQVNFEFFAQIDKHWSSSVNLTQDLSDDTSKTRKGAINLTYTDECFTLGVGYQRKNISFDGIESDNQIFLIINFKNLGSI